MKKTLVLAAMTVLAVLTFTPPPAQAAVAEAWVHRYSNVVSNSNDQAYKVVRDTAGNIIVTGSTDDRITGQDILTIKYSGADGSVLWQQRYDGPAHYNDQPNALAVDSSGNVVVTGFSDNGPPSYETDYYTVKYAAANGALLWEKRYNGPANSRDEASGLAVDSNGNVAVTGFSFNPTNPDYYTAKYAAADGSLLWEKRYNGGTTNGYDQAHAVAVDGSGNVIVTGSSYSGARSTYYTAKYAAADGAVLWETRSSTLLSGFDQARAMAIDSSGNVVLTGVFNSQSQFGSEDYYTVKYAAANGALLWERRYDGPAHHGDEAKAVAVDGNGNVVVTGGSYNATNSDYYTAKYAATDGALLWEQRYNGSANGYDFAFAVAVDGGGNVLVAGYSNSDYYTAKYAAADGVLLWENRRAGGGAAAVAVDGSGNVVVTGSSYIGLNSTDYYTAKYAATDGAVLWEQTYNGLSKSRNIARAVVADGSGNMVVTGYSEGNGGSGDYYTAKYAVADGSLLWEKRSNGLENYLNAGQAVAVDGSDNVVMMATSPGPYYIAKYAAADGALLWEKGCNGSTNTCYYAQAVTVDGSGNVVVTGHSDNGGGNFYDDHDYYTAKYAAADGVLLWEKRYNGPANSDDRANAVALDGSGNVVVTGSIDGTQNPYENYSDYYTVKYAAADGAVLWEKRYSGPANKRDQANAVAVDASGNVVVTGVSDAVFDCYECVLVGDFYTAKYAAGDGSLLWEKRYNGPTNGFDFANAVAVDRSGNVVLTGYSDGSGGGYYEYYTAKYAAADGALLWEKRYNGPVYYPSGVAVDGSGNVVVTGTSDFDYYTAKYAAADGALLWEKRYNGPANRVDQLFGLALGPNGMVAVTGSSSDDYATVVYRDDVYPISIALIPTGIRLRFTGIPGRSYTIERAPAVTGPWIPINTQTAPASGLLEYIDTTPPAGSAFYRTAQP